MYESLNEMGLQYGLNFADHDWLSNSRPATLLGEYIHLQSPDYEDAYHEAVFKAYFTDGKNIGDQLVLSDILHQLGLNPVTLSVALNDPASEAHMQKNSQAATLARVTGTPTFFIGTERVVGAQPYSHLLAAAHRALGLTLDNYNDLPLI